MVLIREEGGWERAALTSYHSEAALQELLADDPSLLPGCAGAAAAREVSIKGAGAVDLVCVDSEGNITLVECKLRANPQIRREVIGQILAYASSLQGADYQTFDEAFTARAGGSIPMSVSASAGFQVDADRLRELVEQRLRTGSFRLIVAVDQITDELRRSVEYLNQHLAESVVFMALELGYLKRGEVEVLVPQTYGTEAEILRGPKSPSRRRWTSEDIRAAIAVIPDTNQRVFAQKLLEHARLHQAIEKGGTGIAPSASYHYMAAGKRRSLWSLYLRDEGPVVAINLGSVANDAPNVAKAMVLRLQRCELLSARLGTEREHMEGKYPEFSIGELAKDAACLAALLDSFDVAITLPGPLHVRPFTAAELEAQSSARDEDVILVADWLTRHLSREAVKPMQSSRDFIKYRYVPSHLGGAFSAIGLREPPPNASPTRLWLRYHSQTPGFERLHRNLSTSDLAVRLTAEGGHLWIPLHIPADADSQQIATALLSEVEMVDKIAAGAADRT